MSNYPRKTFPAPWRREMLFPAAACLLALSGCANRKITEPLPHVTSIGQPEFRQTMGSLVGPGFVAGNSVQTLNNGDQIFPAMLAAIRSAQHSVNFETFVFEKSEVGEEFAKALEERARAGVPVKVVLDAVGAKKSHRYWAGMRQAGIQLGVYHPVFSHDFLRYNFRTHRKLLVVDGKIAFIGGVGIARQWQGNASSPQEWRDLHFRVTGPVVAQLQAAFQDNWHKTNREVLQGADYFPVLKPTGPVLASAFFSSPSETRSAVELMDHLAIASARCSLLIESPYFLPSNSIRDALCDASRRGVRIQILMPGAHLDQKAVRRASRKHWRKLLDAGVQLYEYEPTMIHTKLMIVDGLFVSLGSANFDLRSLRINDEANLNILDAAFAQKLTRIFQGDLRQAQPVTEDKKGAIKQLPQAPAQAAQAPVESQL